MTHHNSPVSCGGGAGGSGLQPVWGRHVPALAAGTADEAGNTSLATEDSAPSQSPPAPGGQSRAPLSARARSHHHFHLPRSKVRPVCLDGLSGAGLRSSSDAVIIHRPSLRHLGGLFSEYRALMRTSAGAGLHCSARFFASGLSPWLRECSFSYCVSSCMVCSEGHGSHL